MLIPSTITARRTRRYTSTWYIHPTTHKHDFEPMDGRGRYIFQPPQCQAVNPSRWSTLPPPFTEPFRNAWWHRVAGVAGAATRRISGWNSRRHSLGPSAPRAGPRSFPVPHQGDGQHIPSRSPAWMPAAAGASASWNPAISSTGEPCSARCPDPQRYHGSTSPLLSFRRSLSLVPPSAKSRRHLHEILANDARNVRWVNSISAFSLIFASAVTGPNRRTFTFGYTGFTQTVPRQGCLKYRITGSKLCLR